MYMNVCLCVRVYVYSERSCDEKEEEGGEEEEEGRSFFGKSLPPPLFSKSEGGSWSLVGWLNENVCYLLLLRLPDFVLVVAAIEL